MTRSTGFPTSPFGELLGMVVVEAANGRAIVSVEIRENLCNSAGKVHGGALSAIADGSAGTALTTTLSDGEFPVTTDASISYFRPVQSGTLVCKAEVIHKGKRLARVETSLLHKDQLIARASASFMIVEKRAGAA